MAEEDAPEIPESSRVKYLERRINDLKLCNEALSVGDFETIEKIAHRLKGNGATFGYPDLSLMGEELEKMAISSNSIELERLLLQLATWIDKQSV